MPKRINKKTRRMQEWKERRGDTEEQVKTSLNEESLGTLISYYLADIISPYWLNW